MKQWFKSVFAVAAVVVFAAAAYAGMATVSGEVTKYEAGKTIVIKDAKGATQTLEISKDTKVEGEVKMGAKVSVEADGSKAHSVKVGK
ncbi:MAG TPA: hypothetical protein VFN94_03875 [Nitrospiria bacterium]|nr:hypothetical protein [Nitrospiria bacterium]